MRKPEFAAVEVPAFRIALPEGWQSDPEAINEAARQAAELAEHHVLLRLQPHFKPAA